MDNSSFWAVKDGFQTTKLIGIIILVITILVVAIRLFQKINKKPPSPDQRIQTIVEEQSPDDFTFDNASELSKYADGMINGNLSIDNTALLLLIRAFTFGRGETLRPNYSIASNLVEIAISRKVVNDKNPDLLFLRSTITARTASFEKDLTRANELLALAATNESFEARAKISQGSFLYCVNTAKASELEKKKIFDELLSPGSGGPSRWLRHRKRRKKKGRAPVPHTLRTACWWPCKAAGCNT